MMVVLSDDGSIVGVLDHDVVAVNKRTTTRVAPTLGDVIGAYKSLVTIQYIRTVSMATVPKTSLVTELLRTRHAQRGS